MLKSVQRKSCHYDLPLNVVGLLLADGWVVDLNLCLLPGFQFRHNDLRVDWFEALLVNQLHMLPLLCPDIGNNPPLHKLDERERRSLASFPGLRFSRTASDGKLEGKPGNEARR